MAKYVCVASGLSTNSSRLPFHRRTPGFYRCDALRRPCRQIPPPASSSSPRPGTRPRPPRIVFSGRVVSSRKTSQSHRAESASAKFHPRPRGRPYGCRVRTDSRCKYGPSTDCGSSFAAVTPSSVCASNFSVSLCGKVGCSSASENRFQPARNILVQKLRLDRREIGARSRFKFAANEIEVRSKLLRGALLRPFAQQSGGYRSPALLVPQDRQAAPVFTIAANIHDRHAVLFQQQYRQSVLQDHLLMRRQMQLSAPGEPTGAPSTPPAARRPNCGHPLRTVMVLIFPHFPARASPPCDCSPQSKLSRPAAHPPWSPRIIFSQRRKVCCSRRKTLRTSRSYSRVR